MKSEYAKQQEVASYLWKVGLKAIRVYLKDIPKSQRLEPSMKHLILSLIRDAEKKKQTVDFITLSSSLLFSGKFAKDYKELEQETFYNCVKKSDYLA